MKRTIAEDGLKNRANESRCEIPIEHSYQEPPAWRNNTTRDKGVGPQGIHTYIFRTSSFSVVSDSIRVPSHRS